MNKAALLKNRRKKCDHKPKHNICNYCGSEYIGLGKSYCSVSCTRRANPHPPIPIEQRFWAKVGKKSEDECWEWLAYKNKLGYGVFRGSKKSMLAHRMAWQLEHGYIPDGLLCCHHCDNPSCCNPSHLFLGTDKDNHDDMIAKGRDRHPRGIRKSENSKVYMKGILNGQSKLSDEDVICIRLLSMMEISQAQLGRIYNISPTQIHHIVKRHAWGHI